MRQTGPRFIEMDCILWRVWIERTAASQSANYNWFGMYAVRNNLLLIVTLLHSTYHSAWEITEGTFY